MFATRIILLGKIECSRIRSNFYAPYLFAISALRQCGTTLKPRAVCELCTSPLQSTAPVGLGIE